MIAPKYSPTIELGHILQVVVIVVMVSIVAVPAYVELAKDDAATQARVSAIVSALAAFQAATYQRFSEDEHDTKAFRDEQRDTNDKIKDAISAIRELVATRGKR